MGTPPDNRRMSHATVASSHLTVSFHSSNLHTSGRSPKISGNTLPHAVNNSGYAAPSHALDIRSSGSIIADRNMFQNIKTPLLENLDKVFVAPSTQCAAALGYTCQVNTFGSSGTFIRANTSTFSKFSEKTAASVVQLQ